MSDQTNSIDKKNTHLLSARGLRKVFMGRDGSETVAIDDINIDLYSGEVVALIGESGSGKTTLGRALIRLLTLDKGSISFKGEDLLSLKGTELRHARRHFQMIFQNQQANLHPKMNVAEMIDESLRLHRPELNISERLKVTDQLLDRVGLNSHHMQYLASLSGGEQRRVGLARILATTPQLVIADEPTSGLDAAIKLQIIALLRELKDANLTYLLISHDLNLVRRIADRVIVMLRGRVIEEIPISELGRRAHHPYTEKLLAAAELGDRDLSFDRASIEDIEYHSSGCHYISICPLAKQQSIQHQCQTQRPGLSSTSPSSTERNAHRVACFAELSSSTSKVVTQADVDSTSFINHQSS